MYDSTIEEHSATAQRHHEAVMKAINSLKDEREMSGINDVMDKININLGGDHGGGLGGAAAALLAGQGGLGGNGVWPILLLALLGRNGGLFGGNDAGGIGLQNTVDTNAILQGLGDLKAAVPLSESQLQLAIANANSDITSQTLQQTIALTGAIAGSKDATVSAAANIANLIQNVNNGLGDKIDANTTQQAIGFGGINTAIERNGWQVTQAINADGEKTRALIQSIDKQNDSRLITAQANEIIELKSERARDSDRHGIEINMINNQNQNQLQFQQQAQILSQLANCIADVGQVARATNQQLIIGNSGVTTGGAQTANPTNVRA